MLNKIKFVFLLFVLGVIVPGFSCKSWAVSDMIISTEVDETEEIVDQNGINSAREASANAVAGYEVEGSLFEQITNLEQEKILMQLEKERAQLDLELDRLAAEKIKLHMEIDTLSGRAEQQQQEFATEKARLEAEVAKLSREKEDASNAVTVKASVSNPVVTEIEKKPSNIAENYKLVNVYGAGNQLQATLSDLTTGQTKRISVGKTVNGYTVKSISLDEGIVFTKDGETETLNVSSNR